MSGKQPSKISQPLQKKLGGDSAKENDWDQAEVESTDTVDLVIHVDADQISAAEQAIENAGGSIDLSAGGEIHASATAVNVFQIADIDSVRLVSENVPPEPHAISDSEISEGVQTANVDALHDNHNLTGTNTTIAVIDLNFDKTNPKYGPNGRDQVVDTIGPDGAFSQENGHHGTACAEVVSDMAPDADIVLASAYHGVSNILDDMKSASYDVDAATMSLGYRQDRRIDGLDGLSKTIENDFTSDGNLFAVSAGNEAAGKTWDGPWKDTNNNDVLEFDDSQTERLGLYTYNLGQGGGGDVIVHWDDDWTSPNNEFRVRLFDSDGNEVANSEGANGGVPFEIVSVPTISDGSQTKDYEIEIDRQSGSDTNLHFDVLGWGNIVINEYTPERSIGVPATSQDDNTLAVAAVQATSNGRTNEDYLKPYSSRGPTQDGRQGIAIAAPSKVSQTDNGYGQLGDEGGFNGTSAASPHVGGVIGALRENSNFSAADIRDALISTGTGVSGDGNDNESSVAAPPNRKLGGGHMDAKAAHQNLTSAVDSPLNQVGTSSDLGGDAQFNTPAVDSESGNLFVGGLQKTFYALSTNDLESQSWTKDRGNKPGLSDSSAHVWTSPDQNKVFFGTGQGKVFGFDTDDGTEHWSGQDIPDLGTAVTSSPVSAGGNIIVGTNDGRVFAWDGSTATKQWEKSVDSGMYSELATDSSRVYVTTENGTLHALDASNGTKLWTDSSFASFGVSSPTVANNNVYVAADEVYAFDTADSQNSVWTSSGYGGTAGSNPTFNNGTVYVGSADNNLYALNDSNGSTDWTYSAGGTVASTPAVTGSGDIAFASMDGMLHLIDSSGSAKDTVSIPADTRASPVVHNGKLYLPTASGVVHAFE